MQASLAVWQRLCFRPIGQAAVETPPPKPLGGLCSYLKHELGVSHPVGDKGRLLRLLEAGARLPAGSCQRLCPALSAVALQWQVCCHCW